MSGRSFLTCGEHCHANPTPRGIAAEIKEHAPFTALGAVAGILFLWLFHGLSHETAHDVFYVLHPAHVLLSAMVTSSLFILHRVSHGQGKPRLWELILVGYLGSVGIATISDSLIPYLGETLLDLPRRAPHLGFIEMWWLVNPLALLGIAAAYARPSTQMPHTGHVLLSIWASLFHIFMAKDGSLPPALYIPLFVFLFLAVLLPCCVSDIVFPLLFVRRQRGKE